MTPAASAQEKTPAGQGEGKTENPQNKGPIVNTVTADIARRILNLKSKVALDRIVGQNLRTAAMSSGVSRTALQSMTGDSWIHTQRAWFGVSPLSGTVLAAQVALGADTRTIWPAMAANQA